MRHARTPKFQLSGPTVHSLYCGQWYQFMQTYIPRAMNQEQIEG